MFSAATIPFDPEEQDFDIQDLLEHLAASLPFECKRVEWKGFATTVPQVRVATAVPLTIQIEDDPDYVPDDLADLADRAEGVLAAEWVAVLRRCGAKLEVMAADVPLPEVDENGALHLVAETPLDPSHPDVEAVLIETARFVGSLAYDNVNDEWLVPEG
jgi:hypothetical protein